MGKGDHRRSYAHSIPGVEYARKMDAIDWTQDPKDVPKSKRVCQRCGADKPSGRWCEECNRETDSERVYL